MKLVIHLEINRVSIAPYLQDMPAPPVDRLEVKTSMAFVGHSSHKQVQLLTGRFDHVHPSPVHFGANRARFWRQPEKTKNPPPEAQPWVFVRSNFKLRVECAPRVSNHPECITL
jgi:hypothetical protein